MDSEVNNIEIQEKLIDMIYDLRSSNVEPSKVTLGMNIFNSLKDDLELLTGICAPNESARFFGIEITIDKSNHNEMRVD